MKPVSLTQEAHSLIKQKLYSGDIAIDATVGNGYDTLFLAKQVGATGKVYGFDIQQAALDSTRSRLEKANLLAGLTLIHGNHGVMAEKVPVQYHGKINAIMFNLGYLPGGDKTIITQTNSTLTSLNSAGRLLSAEGIITLIAYPGHDGGDIETARVKNWCDHLNKNHFTVRSLTTAENKATAPVLFWIYKTA
jgi:hypothetical protein